MNTAMLNTFNQAGISIRIFRTAPAATEAAKMKFKTTDITHPVIITNSEKGGETVMCVCRINKHTKKKRLQMNATLATNKSQRINNFV